MKKISVLLHSAFFVFISFCFSQHTTTGSKQNQTIDSLLALLPKAKEDTTKVKLLNKLSREHLITGNYDSVVYFGNSALQLATRIENETNQIIVKKSMQKSIIASYSAMGTAYWSQGDYNKALENNFLALKKLEDQKEKAKLLGNIGVIYSERGDYLKALDFYFQALKISEEFGEKNGIAKNFTNIGNIYAEQEDYSKALDYYLKALKISEDMGNSSNIITNLANIGMAYSGQKEYSKALSYIFRALKMEEETGDKRGMAISLGLIATIYGEQKNYYQALDYCFKALKLRRALGAKNLIASCLGNIGELYISQKQYKKAKDYLIESLELSTLIGDTYGIMCVNENLSNLYVAMGKHELALEHYQKAIALKDTLFNEEKNKEITRKEMNYEFEKKEAAAKAEQDKKDAIAAGEKKKHRLVIYFISAGLVLMLFCIMFIIIGYRQKIRANAIIASKNEEISMQKANITGQEEERKRIAQELHDGIGGTLAGSKLNLVRINSFHHIPELEFVITTIGDLCKEIRTISHNLAPPAFSNKSSFVETLNEMIRKFIIPGKLKIHFDHFNTEELNTIPQNIQSDVYRIVQELLANIIKHAEANKAEVELSKQENELFLLVEDNGKGFDTAAVQKGIGLQNIHSRLWLVGGNMILDSKTGRGTAINIRISLADKMNNKYALDDKKSARY